jgi:hypothetical protein
MLEDVAMIHERVFARCRLIESNEKLRFVLNKHHVLPAREMPAACWVFPASAGGGVTCFAAQ